MDKRAFILFRVSQKGSSPEISLTDFFLEVVRHPTWVGSHSDTPLLEIADDFSMNDEESVYSVALSWVIVDTEIADFYLFVPRFVDRIRHELPLFYDLVGCRYIVGEVREFPL